MPSQAKPTTFETLEKRVLLAGVIATMIAPTLTDSAAAELQAAALSPSKVVFTTFQPSMLAGKISGTISIVLKDANGDVAVAPAGGTVVSLSTTSGTGNFRNTANNANITSVTIAAGTSTASFKYLDSSAGTPTLTAAASGMTAAQQQAKVDATAVTAVKADPNQLGSYASHPPTANTNNDVYNFSYINNYDWIDRPADAPLPTNDWWTNILKSAFTGNTFPLPMRLNNSAGGVQFSLFSGINADGGNIVYGASQSITVTGQGTTFTRDALVNYGDWTVKFRMEKSASDYIDVTMGRGLPYTWFEYHNISPFLNLGGVANYGAFDASGSALGNSFTTDRFRVDKGGRQFGIFAPAGTQFTVSGAGMNVTFAGDAKYLVVAALPDAANATFNLFYQHAYAIPRNSTYSWTYDAVAGEVATKWDLQTEALKSGASLDTIQGWLPHNYRDINSGPTLLAGYQYPTISGPLKLSAGKSFTIVQPTNGVNFVLPAPQAIGGAADFNAQQMAYYLSAYNTSYTSSSDTYWAGKILSEYAEYTLMAQQLGDPNFARLRDTLRTAVTDWLTYTPGETARYYARYDKDKALVGFGTSFGSEGYTDHHFHYGYLTAAAGVMGMLDPAWMNNYKAMAVMVAKEYANWDRNDKSFPFLRTFDPWSGHSYAAGMGDGRGNNQESSSEAIQSWLGLVLLGQVLNDPEMTAAGMMGYTLEAKTMNEYWLDIAHDDLTPSNFGRPSVAINYDDARQYQTFFGLNPEYSLGIVAGVPIWPAMDVVGKHPENMQNVIDAMLNYRKQYYNNANAGTWESFETITGGDWENVNLGIQAAVDPQKAAVEFARMWTNQTALGKDKKTGLWYYHTQSYRTYGLRDWNYHLTLPLGGVYTNESAKTRTYVVYNPNANAQTVQVRDANGNVVDSFSAAGRQTTVKTISFAAGQIKGQVYNDPNSNGVREGGENAIAGWQVYLDANNNNVLDAGEQSAVTDAAGAYAFTDLSAGTYYVRQVIQNGYRRSQPVPPTNAHTVALAGGQTIQAIDFGNTRNILLSGVVYNDANGNGVRDAGENAIAGVTVDIISNNQTIATRTTDATGFWQVKGLSAGTGSATVQLPGGFTATFPAAGIYAGTMSAGQQNQAVNFGLRRISPAPTPAFSATPILASRSSDDEIESTRVADLV